MFTHQRFADTLEQRIRDNRVMTIAAPWANEIIFPYYSGLSIYNLVHTVGAMLGAPLPGSTPLDPTVWGDSPPDGIDRVVLIISDGLAYKWLAHYMEEDADLRSAVGEITGGRGPIPLTSILPSTTSNALTTLWTGASTAVHGMTGFKVFLREISTLAIPLFFAHGVGPIVRESLVQSYGLTPETFVPVRGLAEHLAESGIPTYSFLRYDYMGSGISRILHRGIPQERWIWHRYQFDKWLRLRQLLSDTRGQRCYIAAYLPAVDDVSHAYGSGTPEAAYTIKRQMMELRDVLVEESSGDGRTMVLIAADHGHHNTTQQFNLRQDAHAGPIFDALRGFVGGEARISNLYLRSGHKPEVINTLMQHFRDTIAWIDPQKALDAGLFGPGTPYAETIHRLGDLILLPRLGWEISDGGQAPPPLRSHHGGMSEWEMLVPLLWRKL